jgi:hypothetical protein
MRFGNLALSFQGSAEGFCPFAGGLGVSPKSGGLRELEKGVVRKELQSVRPEPVEGQFVEVNYEINYQTKVHR